MDDQETCKSLRTTKEQIECYLAFLRCHPEIKLNKNDPTHPKRIEELWRELAEQLNALKGPVRSAAKWKECLSHWKNQVRSRARKAKADRMATGGGPCTQAEVTEIEQQALDTFGATVIDGVVEMPILGTEDEIIINCDPSSPMVVTEVLSDIPSSSRSKKTTAEDMFGQMLNVLKQKNENEEKYREESLKCMSDFCNSMNNVATAILALSQSVISQNQ